MRILIYTSQFHRSVRMLLETFRTLESTVGSEHITSLQALVLHLRQPIGIPSVGILMPPDSSELTALVGFRHLLRDMRIILVLPNADASTMATAHLLRPRYISYGDGDLSDVVAVTSKLVRTFSTAPSNMPGPCASPAISNKSIAVPNVNFGGARTAKPLKFL